MQDVNNYKYWEEYYQTHERLGPSPFALSLSGLRGRRMVDMGCGDGRDTYFFAEQNDVIGVDTCAPVGEMFVRETIEDFMHHGHKTDVLYCRFLFHAIEESLETDILKWALDNAKDVCIECRSDSGSIPDKTHYRRLINGNALLGKCIGLGYMISSYTEQTGLAVFGGEDPVIIRLLLHVR